MTDLLMAARELAERVRFSADQPVSHEIGQPRQGLSAASTLFLKGLEISSALIPKLSDRLDQVCERLVVPRDGVTAFVYSSPTVQAECLLGQPGQCVMAFTSGLVDLLDEDEFEFVAGHEIGHFLLNHQRLEAEGRQESPGYFLRRRAQEISVDRIGLLGCRSLDTALRALMKTVSGLTSRHLRFDVGAFVSQLRRVDMEIQVDDTVATHPAIVIRSKALLWFSMSGLFTRGAVERSSVEMEYMDRRVERDLRRFVNDAALRMVEAEKRDLLLWRLAYEVVQGGVFSRAAQAELERLFDAQTATSLKTFLSGKARGELETLVQERICAARERLELLIPDSFVSEISEIETEVERAKPIIVTGVGRMT